MKIPANILQRRGYRLPTETEWEQAVRAGAVTSRHYGLSVDLLGQYAWYQTNSQNRARPCGSLKPNDLGLFDMLGNVFEWCQERHISYLLERADSPMDDILDEIPRVIRGGAFNNAAAHVRSANRGATGPTDHNLGGGFRPVRTLY
jgi:formylglycine-generating enzyme required for sulfatase activity